MLLWSRRTGDEWPVCFLFFLLKLTTHTRLHSIKPDMFSPLAISQRTGRVRFTTLPKFTGVVLFWANFLFFPNLSPLNLNHLASPLLPSPSLTHTHFTQRYMSGVIMDHANAHGTTRLEIHCCWMHSEHTHSSLSNHIDILLMPLALSVSHPL